MNDAKYDAMNLLGEITQSPFMKQELTINHPQLRQQGFSLIELMVAITISLILLAGVGQIYLSSKTSYNLQDGMGRLQENARFALDIMSHSIGQGGYASPSSTAINAFDGTNDNENFTQNADLGFTTAAKTASDTIQVKYYSATDCLGNSTGSSGIATDKYYLNGNNLMCLGNGSTTAGVIAEGVENMQILYGEDTDGGFGDGVANKYVDADNVSDWSKVVSVRVAVLVSTVQSVGGGVNDSKTYSLLNTPLIGPFNDHVIRRAFSRTILLRNHS